jgi:hypothetical protein
MARQTPTPRILLLDIPSRFAAENIVSYKVVVEEFMILN